MTSEFTLCEGGHSVAGPFILLSEYIAVLIDSKNEYVSCIPVCCQGLGNTLKMDARIGDKYLGFECECSHQVHVSENSNSCWWCYLGR